MGISLGLSLGYWLDNPLGSGPGDAFGAAIEPCFCTVGDDATFSRPPTL